MEILRIKDLHGDHQEPFTEWLRGSCCPLIKDVPMEEQDGYYQWDYDEWYGRWPGRKYD